VFSSVIPSFSKSSLKEKEILLKEVHHRVKNNMQVISSMLKLQSQYISDKNALDLFRDSQHRVKSMALVHEKLYQSKNFEEIDFDQYLKLLTINLFRSFSISNSVIKTHVDSKNVKLDITKAVPCGLIINELISNSLKHAFTNRDKGNIHLKISKVGKEYHLICKDDGVGFPEELDFNNTDTLGMQLIHALTQQLHGKISLNVNDGTEFLLIFPEKL